MQSDRNSPSPFLPPVPAWKLTWEKDIAAASHNGHVRKLCASFKAILGGRGGRDDVESKEDEEKEEYGKFRAAGDVGNVAKREKSGESETEKKWLRVAMQDHAAKRKNKLVGSACNGAKKHRLRPHSHNILLSSSCESFATLAPWECSKKTIRSVSTLSAALRSTSCPLPPS